MATVKISALTELTTTAATDELVIVDKSSSTTKRITVSNLIDLPTAPAGIADNTNKEYNLKLTDVSGTETLTWVEESTEVPTTPSGIANDTSKEYNLKLTDVGGTETLTWVVPTDNDTTYSNFAGTTAGLVPTSTSSDDTKFLRADGTWVVPTDNDTTYTASDFKLDDLAVPDDNTDLDFSTTKHGLTPKGTNTGKFLKDDGTWGTPTDTDTDTTYSNFAGTTAGLVPTSTTTDDTKFLRADGTWVVPTDTDTDTTYSTATTTTTGLVKIEDATAVTATAEAVSTTTNRTYGVQLNGSAQAVVNVPWTEGASTTKGFYEHPKEITTAVTITTDYNAVTVGPITYSGAGSITVPSGSTWVILQEIKLWQK